MQRAGCPGRQKGEMLLVLPAQPPRCAPTQKVSTLGPRGLGGGWHPVPRAPSCPLHPAGEGVPRRLGSLSGLLARVAHGIRQLAIREQRLHLQAWGGRATVPPPGLVPGQSIVVSEGAAVRTQASGQRGSGHSLLRARASPSGGRFTRSPWPRSYFLTLTHHLVLPPRQVQKGAGPFCLGLPLQCGAPAQPLTHLNCAFPRRRENEGTQHFGSAPCCVIARNE